MKKQIVVQAELVSDYHIYLESPDLSPKFMGGDFGMKYLPQNIQDALQTNHYCTFLLTITTSEIEADSGAIHLTDLSTTDRFYKDEDQWSMWWSSKGNQYFICVSALEFLFGELPRELFVSISDIH